MSCRTTSRRLWAKEDRLRPYGPARDGIGPTGITSACDPWFRYVAFATSPPEYPRRVERMLGRFRIRSCIPQKHPPARIAFSTPPLTWLPVRQSSVDELPTSYPAASKSNPDDVAPRTC